MFMKYLNFFAIVRDRFFSHVKYENSINFIVLVCFVVAIVFAISAKNCKFSQFCNFVSTKTGLWPLPGKGLHCQQKCKIFFEKPAGMVRLVRFTSSRTLRHALRILRPVSAWRRLCGVIFFLWLGGGG
ncbi:hypothetical protein PHA77_01660 [Edwardsiella tarda]|uniref:hypothetical protein n=1 Tax=Edwardsiella tarda TaxID=636 RepID=UPI002443C34B|nr:hypothetical protein [Edwardsiella tarda]WGE29402.1 hypothetical protein PHA77_01660 [Edwardsiella tarda]